jgi:hypothetical protein
MSSQKVPSITEKAQLQSFAHGTFNRGEIPVHPVGSDPIELQDELN